MPEHLSADRNWLSYTVIFAHIIVFFKLSLKYASLSLSCENISLNLRREILFTMERINRIKVILAEKERTNKWLAAELGINPSTVSKWCTNSSQPDIALLVKIAKLLDVELDELFNKEFIQSI